MARPETVSSHRPARVTGACRRSVRLLLLAAGLVAVGWPADPARAHGIRLISADDLTVQTPGDPNANTMVFTSIDEDAIQLDHDPRTTSTEVLVIGVGPNAGTTGLIPLDPANWTRIDDGLGQLVGYQYADGSVPAPPITAITWNRRELQIAGGGPSWPWSPGGSQDEIWVYFVVADSRFCARFAPDNATVVANTAGDQRWTAAAPPIDCSQPLCGNGIRESGEVCDDGNYLDGDGCSADCQDLECDTPTFDSTFDGIQEVVFDGYSCSSAGCHAAFAPKGGLDLTAGSSYQNLVNVESQGGPLLPNGGGALMKRVEPGEAPLSFLWEKIAAKTLGLSTTGNPMPTNLLTVTEAHLEAIETWIRAGAPEDLVVEGTAALLGTCLPPEDPLKLLPPPPPLPQGEGIQLVQTAWPLPAQSEDEICFATYYDFTQTNLVPPEVQVDCPGYGSANNPSGKCFYYNRRILRQDGQSHHSIIHIYTGDTGATEDVRFCSNAAAEGQLCTDDASCDSSPGAGDGVCTDSAADFLPYTLKPNILPDPNAGQPCDPFAIDPALGYNPDCSSRIVSGVACTGHGPTDSAIRAPSFAGSQEPYIDNTYAPGVYGLLPMSGVVIWNSHAFNLTDLDSTMAQYLDIYFAYPSDQVWPAVGIFDIDKIFVQSVPPFQQREYCKTFTTPPGAAVFELSSHMHRFGSQFRIWKPPQTPCDPGGFAQLSCEPNCQCGPGQPQDLIYFSQSYTDPVQLEFDPPMILGEDVEDRTFLYCGVYDNGFSDPALVKRQSTSPAPPPFEINGLSLELGGPCGDQTQTFGALFTVPGVMCMDGPNQGVGCGDAKAAGTEATFCETAPGAGDGVCDACNVMGGFTTEDEMFILLGSFYIPTPEPGVGVLGAVAVALLAGWRRRFASRV